LNDTNKKTKRISKAILVGGARNKKKKKRGRRMMGYTCFSCIKEEECPHCCQEMEVPTKYSSEEVEAFPIELQERFVYEGRCCECGSTRVEQ
jgi:hypothetical protein